MIEKLKNDALSKWWNIPTDAKRMKKKISLIAKIKNEKTIETYRKKLFATLKQIPADKERQQDWQEILLCQIKEMEASISHYNTSILDFFIESGYGEVTNDFIDEVKRFDANMGVYDIFQAIRNVWIMNSIQILFEMEVKLTPSIFAYSMLYPYSDNYLDDPNITLKEKMQFSQRFQQWLQGEKVSPENAIEEHIYQLVMMIEEEFDRNQYPQVFKGLLAIHRAQEQSLTQQKEKTLPYAKDILGISFEKGGTSVLADAYLVRGDLDQEEANFMFLYGVFLQLIDDLQDAEDDGKASHMTMFSQLRTKYPLDSLVQKLMNFIDWFHENDICFRSEKANVLKQVIRDCSYVMLAEAVSKQQNNFSKTFMTELKQQSMVRFSYLKKVKKKFQRTFSADDIVTICGALTSESFVANFNDINK